MRDTDLQIFVEAEWENPSFPRQFQSDFPMNPRAPTSTVMKETFYFVCSEIWFVKSMYFVSFLTFAALMPSSAGQVSSMSKTFRDACDQIIISGLSLVLIISGGNTICSLSKSTRIFQSSEPSSSHFLRTFVAHLWLCFLPSGTKDLEMCGFLKLHFSLLQILNCFSNGGLRRKRIEACLQV